MRMGLDYCSEEAIQLDSHIFETIYFAAVSESCAIAKEKGPYSSFEGSPASRGVLQFDMWDKTEQTYQKGRIGKDRWESLKSDVIAHRIRNSLLTAPCLRRLLPKSCRRTHKHFTGHLACCTRDAPIQGDFLLCCRSRLLTPCERGLWNDRVRRPRCSVLRGDSPTRCWTD